MYADRVKRHAWRERSTSAINGRGPTNARPSQLGTTPCAVMGERRPIQPVGDHHIPRVGSILALLRVSEQKAGI